MFEGLKTRLNRGAGATLEAGRKTIRKATPRPAKRVKAKPRKSRAKTPGAFGAVDALGFFLLAGVIVSKALSERTPLVGAAGRLASAPQPQAALAESREPMRGRAAESPQQIPGRGWRDILVRTWNEFNQDQIMTVAGGVTFFTLLSLFPAMGAFVSLYGLFADVGAAQKQLSLMSGVLPHDALSFLGDEMMRLAQARRGGGLGIAFVVTLLVSMWSANGAVKSVFYGLNIAYEEREHRNFLRLNLTSLAFTAGFLVFIIMTLSAVIAAPVALQYIGVSAGGAWIAELRWPLLLGVAVFGLSVLYRYGPSRQLSQWRWITPGSLFAAVLWLIASLAFSAYVANFGHFNKTYGSLGAIIGFMTWIWYSTTIVLLGAELNAEIEHQTAVDTTTGAPRGMGDRGATMADTLGPARTKKPKPGPAGMPAPAR